MQRETKRAGALRSGRRKTITSSVLALAAGLAVALSPAHAFSAKDAQILGRVLGFLEPAPSSTVTLALVYDTPASKAAADALAGQIAGKAGNFTLAPKVVKTSEIGGSGANAILLMDGVGGSAASDAVKSKKIPCFTGDSALVRSGACLISIKTDPKVEILVNSALGKASGLGFGAAFKMMITEI
jgi:hypothetical protein